jgi:hypothetical protein
MLQGPFSPDEPTTALLVSKLARLIAKSSRPNFFTQKPVMPNGMHVPVPNDMEFASLQTQTQRWNNYELLNNAITYL